MNALGLARQAAPSSIIKAPGLVSPRGPVQGGPVTSGGPTVRPANIPFVEDTHLKAWYSSQIGVVGASGTQGKAYTWAALQTAPRQGHTVHPVVRREDTYRAGAVVTNGQQTVRLTDDPSLKVSTDPSSLDPGETLFVNAVTASGVGPTLDAMPRGARVVMTQNGVDMGHGNRQGLDIHYGISVITSSPDPASGGVLVKPGGKLQVGADNPFLADVVQAFGQQGVFNLEVVDDIKAAKWEKIALNSALNAPATLFGKRLGDFLELMKNDPRFDKLIAGLVSEVRDVAVAQSVNVKPANQIMETVVGVMHKFPQHPTSMQSVFLQGGETELPVLNEGVSQLGSEVHVPTPLNDLVVQKMKAYEQARSLGGASEDFHTVHADLVRATCDELLNAAAALY